MKERLIEEDRRLKGRRVHTMATELTIERSNFILPHLVQCAKSGSTITYGELGAKIDVHHRVLTLPLGYLRDDICIPRDLPLITALVVNTKSRMPGGNWLPEGTGHLSPDEYHREFVKYRDKAFACDAWDALLEALGLTPIREA
jgi:hypothetical protein